jgi:hypothetical protein
MKIRLSPMAVVSNLGFLIFPLPNLAVPLIGAFFLPKEKRDKITASITSFSLFIKTSNSKKPFKNGYNVHFIKKKQPPKGKIKEKSNQIRKAR